MGNVLATVSDRRTQVDANSDGTVDSYKADIVSANDYYPFGMLMPGRKYSIANTNYRYGFNGKENDNDIENGALDYGMRIYDGRLGKFLSVDPLSKKYPMLTTYQFGSNSPICSIDLDGLEGLVASGMPQPFSSDSRPTGTILTVEDASKINKNVTVAVFKAAFSEQLPKKLIDHYAYGSGRLYRLNKNEIIEIQSVPTGIQGIVETDKEKFDKLTSGAEKGSTIILPEGYSIQGAATTGGTLGRFTISLKGKITFDKKDASKWTFQGTMQFSDTYDFKTNPVTDKDLQRSEWGDIQTKIGKKYLSGEGFTVTSDVIHVNQSSSDASFDWYIGKTANGKQNEISNDMSNHPTEGREALKTGKKE